MSRTVDPRFGRRMREIRMLRGLSLRDLERRVFFSKSYLQILETGGKPPTMEAAARLDNALAAGGELTEMVSDVVSTGDEARTWETAELLRRVAACDATAATVEALHLTAYRLCCEYAWRDAEDLRAEGLRWLREVSRLRRDAGLREHRELLVIAGWLGLLVGCVEYDLGMRSAADATRAAAQSLGTAAGHSEIAAWAWEMSAWFALTQGRFTDALGAARAGQRVAGDGATVTVQLIGQEAKALARIGTAVEVRHALDRGRQLLDSFVRPDRPDHHFVVDPDKWDFYAMDAFRLAADDRAAEHHAHAVLALGSGPGGAERAPMRMAEARLTLAVTAARDGDLDRALAMGMAAFDAPRKSLPSLILVAGELDVELWRRFPHENATAAFRDAFRAVTA